MSPAVEQLHTMAKESGVPDVLEALLQHGRERATELHKLVCEYPNDAVFRKMRVEALEEVDHLLRLLGRY